MTAPVERPIQHWGDFDNPADEAFWTQEAMQGAVALWWHPQRHTTTGLANITLTVDRERGVVVLTEIPTDAPEGQIVEDRLDSDDENLTEHSARIASQEPQYGLIGRPDRPGGV